MDLNEFHEAVARRTVCSFCAVIAIIIKPNEELLSGGTNTRITVKLK